jgi:glycosyltransferase involved in cell wall biosynthesis
MVKEIGDASICLNMIVKNESHIIESTLTKLCDKIQFDYWVICDTGSTDDTPNMIKQFFANKNIPGELFFDEWTNFAHNRSLALQRAYNKTDLLLVFDADDEICGSIEIPKKVLYDQYHLQFGTSYGISYTRVLLINNRKRFEYESVIHEYIVCKEPNSTHNYITGDYYVVSGRSGSRNKDPEKYLKDALILEKAYTEAVSKNDNLYERYAFYCANSYKDHGDQKNAIKWYKITLTHENQWDQEKYMSCFHIYNCYKALGEEETGFFYLVKAFNFDCERVECLYPLLVHYCCEKMYNIAYNYYLNVKYFFENQYLNNNLLNKLFISNETYEYYLPYYMIIIAYRVNNFETGIKMYEILFKKKYKCFEEWYVRHILFNLQFYFSYINKEIIELANEYICFLKDNTVELDNYDFLFSDNYKKAGIIVDKPTKQFNKEECKISKNILIYTGLAYNKWNYTYMLQNALGGSEKAVNYIAKYLALTKEFNIYVSGDVDDEIIHNVHYIHRSKLNDLFLKIPFHTVIISRYINFYHLYKNCCFYKSFIWAHDTEFITYGIEFNNKQIIESKNNMINGCICLTEWHKQLFVNIYPLLKDKFHLINNGVEISEFGSSHTNKIPNRFIYSSRPERGLSKLLNLWPSILTIFPDATLVVASYVNLDDELKRQIQQYNTIRLLGSLNNNELYKEMCISEYWLYPTNWSETSCITALEMLMAEVICIYYPVAGLVNTMDQYGLPIQENDEINTLVSLTAEKKSELRKNGRMYAESCSWENRSKLWISLIRDSVND